MFVSPGRIGTAAIALGLATLAAAPSSAASPTAGERRAKAPRSYGTFRTVYSFWYPYGGVTPSALVAVGNWFYGTTSGGGTYGQGTVFAMNAAGEERVLYSFRGGADGAAPQAGLIYVNGALYGTTTFGGGSEGIGCNGYGGYTKGCGTVFAVTIAGVERVVYAFKGGADAATPKASLTYLNGTLYGATTFGGVSGKGTVFGLSLTGTERVLHSFSGANGDGASPEAGLIAIGGALFGTTSSGGAHQRGCVFEVSVSGAERTLYSFSGSDGASPAAPLAYSNGMFYGVTRYGGSGSCSVYGCGTVFAVDGAGDFRSIYSFKGGDSDGQFPATGLLVVGGVLLGTSQNGGGSIGCGGQGCGVAFEIDASGSESVLHSFNSSPDAENPSALLLVNNTLYGSATTGGAYNEGAVFKLALSGSDLVLHSFGGEPDGSNPTSLTAVGSTLYGTTASGGTHSQGTILRLDPSGAEQTLYNFQGGPDGGYPYGKLLYNDGSLYGTTTHGGIGLSCCGTVFALDRTGAEHVLYRFAGASDGAFPLGALTLVNGLMYGTTENGGAGAACCGTVYSMDVTGQERVLHRFKGIGTDGGLPMAGLTYANGQFVVTNSWGSGPVVGGGCGTCGTVDSVSLSGPATVLHGFGGSSDGAHPSADLIAVNGNFYGTTSYGGATPRYGSDLGTVFKITPSGVEHVLYSFKVKCDGAYPQAGLTYFNGKLYGTTAYGGGCLDASYGGGTIFEMTLSGAEQVLYRFQGNPDGAIPNSDLIVLNGALYGTTQYGGPGQSVAGRHGTVFELIPP